jgi:hypothetical protein
MEQHTAANDEDIAVVKQTIDILNGYLPQQAEDLGDRGAPETGYVERLKRKRAKWEMDSIETNKEVTSGKILGISSQN